VGAKLQNKTKKKKKTKSVGGGVCGAVGGGDGGGVRGAGDVARGVRPLHVPVKNTLTLCRSLVTEEEKGRVFQ